MAQSANFHTIFLSRILYDSHFGFRKNRSTIIQLKAFFRKIDEEIATKSDFDDIFTDFSNAFDELDHGLFSQKIYNMGFRG